MRETTADTAVSRRQILLKEEMERTLALLIEHYRPQKVLLFGSLAAEVTGEWSDIDLVIIKETTARFLDRTKEVMQLLRPRVGMDILVYTPAEFEHLNRERDFIRTEISGKGQVIYERRE